MAGPADRDKVRILLRFLWTCLALFLVPTNGAALPVQESPDSSRENPVAAEVPTWLAGVGARLQMRHTWEHPEGAHTTAVQRGRVWVRGAAQDRLRYLVQAELAGSNVYLLDAQITASLPGGVALRMGQGKVPFGRQLLNSSGALSLVDRSLADGRFGAARRAGIEIFGTSWDTRVHWAAGRFQARGIRGDPGIPGRSLMAGRVVLTPLGPYPENESPLRVPDDPRLAVGIAGLSTTEDRGGQAVPLTRWNGEAALRVGPVQLVGEAFRESPGTRQDPMDQATSPDGPIDQEGAWGGYAQAGVISRGLTHEVVARHAWVRPDGVTRDGPGPAPEEWGTSRSETGIGYTHYLDGHRTKIQGDVHRLRNHTTGANGTRVRVQATVTLW